MNEEITREILKELLSSLEGVETQTAAILQFLNDKGIARKEDLASYLDQAGEASSVRWRAARARIDYLLSSATNTQKQRAPKEPPPTGQAPQQPAAAAPEKAQTKETEETREAETPQQPTPDGERKSEIVDTSAKPHRNKQRETRENKAGQSGENNQTSSKKDAAEKAA